MSKTNPTPEEMLNRVYKLSCRIHSQVKKKDNNLRLTRTQAKLIYGALNTISLYLSQPERVRQTQLDRVLDIRDILEMEFKQQFGEEITKS